MRLEVELAGADRDTAELGRVQVVQTNLFRTEVAMGSGGRVEAAPRL
jgi:hypothetical protein